MSQLIQNPVTEPLRAEHRHLLPNVDRLASAGDSIGHATDADVRAGVEAAYRFLTAHLIPHATAEDEVLYPEIDRLLGVDGATRATDTMRRDHVEVGRMTERLGELRGRVNDGGPDSAEELELRRVLYGLHALVSLHFAKEEEVYLPLLDRELTVADAEALFERMEASGRAAGAAHAH